MLSIQMPVPVTQEDYDALQFRLTRAKSETAKSMIGLHLVHSISSDEADARIMWWRTYQLFIGWRVKPRGSAFADAILGKAETHRFVRY